MDIAQTIEDYQKLRDACYHAARANDGALMGDSRWLRGAIMEWDMELEHVAGNDYINCHGSAFTSQTYDNEHFDFNIPLSALNL